SPEDMSQAHGTNLMAILPSIACQNQRLTEPDALVWTSTGPSLAVLWVPRPSLEICDGPAVCATILGATPGRRARRKSMSRRSGQNGYIERKGNSYYVRFRIDVPGQEKRAHKSVRLCPVSGPGKLTKPERERKAREIITASG